MEEETVTEIDDTGMCDDCIERVICFESMQHDLKAGTMREYGNFAHGQISDIVEACDLCQQILEVCLMLCDFSSKTISEGYFAQNHFNVRFEPLKWGNTVLEVSLTELSLRVRLLLARGPPSFSREITKDSVIGRTVRARQPDYERVMQALTVCHEKHDRCRLPPWPGMYLRVIHCKRRHLCDCRPQRYACLSYVWGPRSVEEIENANDALPDELPRSIEDAISVCNKLGIDYLWVDRYCIDPENKHDIIRQMDQIYGGGEITIIATVGDDPDVGLPGVGQTGRMQQCQLNVNGHVFVDVGLPVQGINNHSPRYQYVEEIQGSKWNSRGWTY